MAFGMVRESNSKWCGDGSSGDVHMSENRSWWFLYGIPKMVWAVIFGPSREEAVIACSDCSIPFWIEIHNDYQIFGVCPTCQNRPFLGYMRKTVEELRNSHAPTP